MSLAKDLSSDFPRGPHETLGGFVINRDPVDFGFPPALLYAVLLVTHSVGAISSKPKVHAILVLLPPVVLAIGTLAGYLRPGMS